MSGPRTWVDRGGRWAGALLAGVVLAGLAAGCGSVDGALAPGADAVLRTRIDFVDARFQPIPDDVVDGAEGRQRYPGADLPDPLILHFGGLPGRLAGPPLETFDRIWLARRGKALEWASQRDFTVNLGYLQRELARVATPYLRRPEDVAFEVRPAQTRFAAVAIGVSDPRGFPLNAFTLFYDWRAQAPLILVYADRPCTMSGRIDLTTTGTIADAVPALRRRFAGVFEHDVTIASPGLHWLRVAPTALAASLVTNVEPAGPIGVVVLENIVALGGPAGEP